VRHCVLAVDNNKSDSVSAMESGSYIESVIEVRKVHKP